MTTATAFATLLEQAATEILSPRQQRLIAAHFGLTDQTPPASGAQIARQ